MARRIVGGRARSLNIRAQVCVCACVCVYVCACVGGLVLYVCVSRDRACVGGRIGGWGR